MATTLPPCYATDLEYLKPLSNLTKLGGLFESFGTDLARQFMDDSSWTLNIRPVQVRSADPYTKCLGSFSRSDSTYLFSLFHFPANLLNDFNKARMTFNITYNYELVPASYQVFSLYIFTILLVILTNYAVISMAGVYLGMIDPDYYESHLSVRILIYWLYKKIRIIFIRTNYILVWPCFFLMIDLFSCMFSLRFAAFGPGYMLSPAQIRFAPRVAFVYRGHDDLILQTANEFTFDASFRPQDEPESKIDINQPREGLKWMRDTDAASWTAFKVNTKSFTVCRGRLRYHKSEEQTLKLVDAYFHLSLARKGPSFFTMKGYLFAKFLRTTDEWLPTFELPTEVYCQLTL